jgi:hypothetical protein
MSLSNFAYHLANASLITFQRVGTDPKGVVKLSADGPMYKFAGYTSQNAVATFFSNAADGGNGKLASTIKLVQPFLLADGNTVTGTVTIDIRLPREVENASQDGDDNVATAFRDAVASLVTNTEVFGAMKLKNEFE